MKTKFGGALPVGQISDFLTASYEERPPDQIGTFKLDTELSNLTVKVYYDLQKRKVVIIFRGTKEASDWFNNLVYGLSTTLYNLTPRFRIAYNTLLKAKKKYKGYQFESLGHSQGGLLAHKLGTTSHSNIQLNPAYKGEFQASNEYIIRSSFDPVSVLKGPVNIVSGTFNPEWSKKHNITIPAESSNPLIEHAITILDRLPQNMLIGRNDKLQGGYVKCSIHSDFPFDSDKKIVRGGAKYPHNMYKGNNLIVAKNEDEHNELEKLGYDHTPPNKPFVGGGKQFFCRIGSKLSLLDKILPLIPPHKKYVEVFVGGGAVYWNKEPVEKEVLNDLDKELIEGYKLLKSMRNKVSSDFPVQESVKNIQKLVDKRNPTKEEKLLQKLYSSCNTFSLSGLGKIYKNYHQKTKINEIGEFVDRMKQTTITNLDYKKVLKQHDSKDTFFFLDPPYEETKGLYKDEVIDYEEMNQLLKSLKGKFLLTINDSPVIRNIFKGFKIKPVLLKSINPGSPIGNKDRKELFIMNYIYKK